MPNYKQQVKDAVLDALDRRWRSHDFDVARALKHFTDDEHAALALAREVLDELVAGGYVKALRQGMDTVYVYPEERAPSEDDAEWRREIAREEGMLNGIDSFNDWMGY